MGDLASARKYCSTNLALTAGVLMAALGGCEAAGCASGAQTVAASMGGRLTVTCVGGALWGSCGGALGLMGQGISGTVSNLGLAGGCL